MPFTNKNSPTYNIIFLREIEKALREKRVPSPLSEAESLICAFAKTDRLKFWSGQSRLSEKNIQKIRQAAKKRGQGVPFGHLAGEVSFCGHIFKVSPSVLTPRPETEILVEETLSLLRGHYEGKSPEMLDLGTGSGCIAASLTIAWPKGRMTALDISPSALAVARKNLKRLGLGDKVKLLKSSYFGAFRGKKKTGWDIIISNPPYISGKDLKKLSREVRREPRTALDGGKSGLESIRRILKDAPQFLKKNGWLLLEIGAGQSQILKKEIERAGKFGELRFVKDLAGIDRVLIARHHG